MTEEERELVRAGRDLAARHAVELHDMAERIDRLQEKVDQLRLQRDYWHRLALRRRQVIERKELYIQQLKREMVA